MIDSSDHSSIRLFSSGVPVIASLNGAAQPARRTGSVLAWWFLTNCASSRTQRRPRLRRRRPSTSMPEQRVRGDHDVGAGDDLGERRAPPARRSRSTAHDLQARGEPGGLARPVADARWSGATTRNGAGRSLGSRAWQTSASACTVLPRPMSSARIPPSRCSPQERQPAEAVELVGPQLRVERRPAPPAARRCSGRAGPAPLRPTGRSASRPRRARRAPPTARPGRR